MDKVPCQESCSPAGKGQELVVSRSRTAQAAVRIGDETGHTDERNLEVSDVGVLGGRGMYKSFVARAITMT